MTTTNPQEGTNMPEEQTSLQDAADAPQDDQQPQQAPTPTPETDDAPEAEEAPQDGKASRDAAKYRRQLRDTQAELETAHQQLDAARRALVDHYAEAVRVRPAALWASGAQLADLLGEDGTVDRALVQQAAGRAVDLLGLAPTPKMDPLQGVGSWAPTTPDFTSAFKPKRH